MKEDSLGVRSTAEIAPESDPPRDLSAGHTPTPWRVDDNLSQMHHRYDEGTRVITSGDLAICHTTRGWDDSTTSPANAAFIVKAVNAHDELVRALRDLLVIATADWAINPSPHPMRTAAVENAHAALAKLSEGLPTPETRESISRNQSTP